MALNKQGIIQNQVTILRSLMKKVLSLIFLMWMVVLTLADLSKATSGNANNSFSTTLCGGSVKCFVGDDTDDVSELLMSSHVARMLYIQARFTGNTRIRNRPSVSCPRVTRYTITSCLPPRSGNSPRGVCGIYNRNC